MAGSGGEWGGASGAGMSARSWTTVGEWRRALLHREKRESESRRGVQRQRAAPATATAAPRPLLHRHPTRAFPLIRSAAVAGHGHAAALLIRPSFVGAVNVGRRSALLASPLLAQRLSDSSRQNNKGKPNGHKQKQPEKTTTTTTAATIKAAAATNSRSRRGRENRDKRAKRSAAAVHVIVDPFWRIPIAISDVLRCEY